MDRRQILNLNPVDPPCRIKCIVSIVQLYLYNGLSHNLITNKRHDVESHENTLWSTTDMQIFGPVFTPVLPPESLFTWKQRAESVWRWGLYWRQLSIKPYIVRIPPSAPCGCLLKTKALLCPLHAQQSSAAQTDHRLRSKPQDHLRSQSAVQVWRSIHLTAAGHKDLCTPAGLSHLVFRYNMNRLIAGCVKWKTNKSRVRSNKSRLCTLS